MSDEFDEIDDDMDEAREIARDDGSENSRPSSNGPFYFNLENEVNLTVSIPMLHLLGNFILDHKEDAQQYPYLIALAFQAKKYGKPLHPRRN